MRTSTSLPSSAPGTSARARATARRSSRKRATSSRPCDPVALDRPSRPARSRCGRRADAAQVLHLAAHPHLVGKPPAERVTHPRVELHHRERRGLGFLLVEAERRLLHHPCSWRLSDGSLTAARDTRAAGVRSRRRRAAGPRSLLAGIPGSRRSLMRATVPPGHLGVGEKRRARRDACPRCRIRSICRARGARTGDPARCRGRPGFDLPSPARHAAFTCLPYSRSREPAERSDRERR